MASDGFSTEITSNMGGNREMPWQGQHTLCCIVGEIPQRVGYLLGTVAGFGVSSNVLSLLVRVYFGDFLVLDNSWIGGFLAMLSLGNIYFHLRTK